METVRSDTPAKDASAALAALLTKHQAAPVLLLLSGGSALHLLDGVDGGLAGSHLTIGVIDERCSQAPSDRNVPQLEATAFFKEALERGASVLVPLLLPCAEADAVAADWETQLRNWFLLHPTGVVIATLGIGPDGHTAGIFPGQWSAPSHTEAWTMAYTVPPTVNPFTNRLTVTAHFLKHNIDHAIVYAVGAEKQPVLNRLLTGDASEAELPAMLVHELRNATLFTDV